jgi:DNA polymerase-1
LEAFQEQQRSAANDALRDLQRSAGREVDPRSHEDLARLFFDELNLPVLHQTRTGQPSTNSQALGQLRFQHQAVRHVEEFQQANMLHSRAAELLHAVSPRDQRIHGHLDPLGTATGRFTSTSPPLQNLPGELRRAVSAPSGHYVLEVDFAQIELRVLAHLSKEPKLRAVFDPPSGQPNVDLHRHTAAVVLRESPEAITDQRREIGKRINFGIIYGLSDWGLARQLSMDVERARELIRTFFEYYSELDRWIDQAHRQAANCGFVETFYGRRRELRRITSSDSAKASAAERQAVNTMVQGTAAEVCKMALARLHRSLPLGSKLLLTVHDSALIQVPEETAEAAGEIAVGTMQVRPPQFEVPLLVDSAYGMDCVRRQLLVCFSGNYVFP